MRRCAAVFCQLAPSALAAVMVGSGSMCSCVKAPGGATCSHQTPLVGPWLLCAR
jgi:hypothetical protein